MPLPNRIRLLMEAVVNMFNITIPMLRQRTRVRNICIPRQVTMFLIRRHFNWSYEEIGGIFDGMDHSTVIHAVKKIEGLLITDETLRSQVHYIEQDYLRAVPPLVLEKAPPTFGT
jgi:chromosomal replication initiator protein